MKTVTTQSKSSFRTALKSLVAVSAALSMSIIVGCNSSEQPTDSTTEMQKITIATEGAYPPFNATDSEGNLIGFDVDLVNALCEEMKADCTIVDQEWTGIIPGLKAGKYDAVIAGMSITSERAEQVDFTDSYFDNTLVFIAEKDTTINPADLTTLDGLTVGTQSSTVSAQWLEKNLPKTEAKLYETIGNAFLDLEAGRVDAILSDKAPAVDWLSTGKSEYTVIGDEIDINDHLGIAVRKEDPLKDKFNTALATIKENGKYEQISDKYFKIAEAQ